MYQVTVQKNDIDPLLQLPIKRTIHTWTYESQETAVVQADTVFEQGVGEKVIVSRLRSGASPQPIYMRVWFEDGEAN